jgi:hypothetical protein
MENNDASEERDTDANRKPLGWRDLLGVVNLKDFVQMVGTEVEQIGTSLRISLESLFRLPFGPIRGFFGLFIVSIRSCLLVMVIFVLGTGIFLATIMRAIGLITPGRTADKD